MAEQELTFAQTFGGSRDLCCAAVPSDMRKKIAVQIKLKTARELQRMYPRILKLMGEK